VSLTSTFGTLLVNANVMKQSHDELRVGNQKIIKILYFG